MRRRNVFKALGAMIVGLSLPKLAETKPLAGTPVYVKLGDSDIAIKSPVKLSGTNPNYFMYTYWKQDNAPMNALCGVHFGPEQYAEMLQLYIKKIEIAHKNGDEKLLAALIRFTVQLRTRRIERCFVPELYDYDKESMKYRDAIEKKEWI